MMTTATSLNPDMCRHTYYQLHSQHLGSGNKDYSEREEIRATVNKEKPPRLQYYLSYNILSELFPIIECKIRLQYSQCQISLIVRAFHESFAIYSTNQVQS